MNLGTCKGCRQRNELHEGVDGWYCEDCLAKNATLDPMSRHSVPVEGGSPEYVPKGRRQEYLEFIITHVTDPWIDKFLDEWKDEMKRSYRWVQELRGIDDDMVLLRMASELGFGKVAKEKKPLVLDNIQLGVDVAREDAIEQSNKPESAKPKRGRRKAKSDTSRNKAKTGS